MPKLPMPPADALALFANTLKLIGVAHTGPEKSGRPDLIGKRLGLINGSSWITLWSYFFGRMFLPGVHLINVGNEAIQINFMEAHEAGRSTPPQANIDAFVRYANELVDLARVDAILITCSTMNRSFQAIQQSLSGYGVPVVSIDQPMMRSAVQTGGKTLVVATHGPTVNSTQTLLRETAEEMGKTINFTGATVEAAWHRLAEGDVVGHNEYVAHVIRSTQAVQEINSVVLAQLSMTVFLLTYPDPVAVFGITVFTSGQYGFEHMAELLIRQ